jgi:kumamolisin
MKVFFCGHRLISYCLTLALSALVVASYADPPLQRVTHQLPGLIKRSHYVGAVASDQNIRLALVLPLRNEAQLADLLRRLYDPTDPACGHYLTNDEFTTLFGPTEADYAAIVAWAGAQGLTITNTYSNRKVVDVAGSAALVKKAFHVDLLSYQAPDGRIFRAPSTFATVPVPIAARLSAVLGLDNAMVTRSHRRRRKVNPFLAPTPWAGGEARAHRGGESGSTGKNGGHAHGPLYGPDDAFGPAGIKKVYDLDSVTQTGTGQVLGLVEFDGYDPTDIQTYENYFGISPDVPLQNVLVDGADGSVTDPDDSGEVTLDIELMTALAPGASKILVYEAPNVDEATDETFQSETVDILNQMVTDNLAKQISTSWGEAEDSGTNDTPTENLLPYFQSENAAFMQMAAQGQSFFDASGDAGAADGAGNELVVDNPGGQPYVTAVGGTTLNYIYDPGHSDDATYQSEVVWDDVSQGGGSGGGVSIVWPIPFWQKGVFSTTGVNNTHGSTTMRNMPDVALDADPNTGYEEYQAAEGGWGAVGGTSCCAPLWAAFTALVNQARVANNCPLLGFVNGILYPLATFNSGENYKGVNGKFADFHDITSGNNNILYNFTTGNYYTSNPDYYNAVVGFDDTTGWGSFDGANLFGDLVSLANTNTLTQLVGNNSFESADGGSSAQYAAAIMPWSATPNVISSSPAEPAHSGLWMAWLCGYGTTHTDTLAQTVRIPSLATAISLSFWLHIDTAETTTTLQNDTLTVQVKDLTANTSQTLATYSNLNAKAGYVQHSFTLSAATYAGHTLQILVTGKENSSLQTSFVFDDFSLAITE